MIYFIITLFLFSSMEVVTKPLMRTTDPFTLTWYRFVLGWFVLTSWSFMRGRSKEIFQLFLSGKKKLLLLAFLGFLNTFFSMSMLQTAVKYATPETAALIFCSNPIFVYLLYVIKGTETVKGLKVIGFILGITGIAIVIGWGEISLGKGALYALAASLAFALYTVLNKKAVSDTSPLTVNIVSFSFGIIAALFYILHTGRNLIPHPSLYTQGGNIAVMLYLGAGVSGIGYITFIKAIKKMSAFSVSLLFMLKPVLAAGLAVVLLGHLPSTAFYAGTVLVLTGIILIKK